MHNKRRIMKNIKSLDFVPRKVIILNAKGVSKSVIEKWIISQGWEPEKAFNEVEKALGVSI